MSDPTGSARAIGLSAMLVLSAVLGVVALSGGAAAATSVSITPSDDDAGAANVSYEFDGNVELANQDTLQFVDVHLGPADVSNVGEADVSIYVDGNEYTDGLSQFDAGGGTVEFKLSNSRSISDGDPIRVVVGDVTNPEDDFTANATFHDTGDAKWQEYAGSVAIDTAASINYDSLSFSDARATGNDTTIETGEDLTVTAKVTNTGEQQGTYNASLVVDGEVTQWVNGTLAGQSSAEVSFETNFSSTGAYDVAVDGLPAMEVTVTGPLGIAGGSASPSSVEAGTTVSNQEVFVTVTNVSQDGDTDWHYVEFSNELTSSLSVNSVSANATSITSSPNIVEGFDDDGHTETVKFATSGDGGGDVDLRLTVDASVTYPDGTATYGIDARTVDSSGEMVTQNGVASISAESNASLSSYSVTNPSDRTISVSFEASEELTDIEVAISDDSGQAVATLSEAHFSETRVDGKWRYEGTYTVDADGTYTATLTTATTADGTDLASGQSGSVTIETSVAAEVGIGGGSASPAQVEPGSTVSNQEVTVDVENVSADGDTDWYYVEFSNELAGNLSVNSVSANSTSITSSAELVDGFDDDGVAETVKFATSADGEEPIDLAVTVDVSVTYPEAGGTFAVDARVEDSSGDMAVLSGVASVEASTSEDTPEVSEFAVRNPEGTELAVTFEASTELDDIAVRITDGDGTTVTTLTEADFSEQPLFEELSYEATVTLEAGTYTARLTHAADAEGLDGADGQSETVTVGGDLTAVVDASADPTEVAAGATRSNQQVTVVVAGLSADGSTDTHYVEFSNELAGNLSVNSASVNGSASIAKSAELVDGFDDDGVAETVRFQTDVEGGGSTTLALTVDLSLAYPTEADTYGVDYRLQDSDGTTASQRNAVSISVGADAVADYAGADGEVQTDELREAINDFILGRIDTDLFQAVVQAWAQS